MEFRNFQLVQPIELVDFLITLNTPLVVCSNGVSNTFSHRNGAHLFIRARWCPDRLPSIDDVDQPIVGIGELVEPVFTPAAEAPSTILAKARELLHYRLATHVDVTDSINECNWRQEIGRLMDLVCPPSDSLPPQAILARFAIEQCMLQLVALAMNKPLWVVIAEWLGLQTGHSITSTECCMQVRLNAMSFSTRNGLLDSKLMKEAVGVVKLKVGGCDGDGSCRPKLEAQVVNDAVHSRMSGGSGTPSSSPWLRLDANQAWTVEEASVFANALTDDTIACLEYIEEPLRAANGMELDERLIELKSQNSFRDIRIALDESLLLPGIEAMIETNSGGLRIVYKPFIHGLSDSKILRTYSEQVVLSCTFETGHGLRFLTHVAAAIGFFGNHKTYHGLFPLADMAESDETTASFMKEIQYDEFGAYVLVDDYREPQKTNCPI